MGAYWAPVRGRRRANFTEELNQAAEAAHTDSCFFNSYFESQQTKEMHTAYMTATKLEIEAHHQTRAIPRGFGEAMKSNERVGWKQAMDKEMDSLTNYSVFAVIDLDEVPPGEVLLDSTWIYALKPTKDNELMKKARLCVRGDTEQGDFTIEEIFAGVIRSENVKLFLAIICSKRWPLVVIDVKTAFLNATLDKPIYLKIPRGAPFDRGKKCWKLLKALYGLRKAPKAWNDELTRTLIVLGYRRCELDWNLFVRKGQNGSPNSYVAFHVDDGLISASTMNILNQIIRELQKKYEIKIEWNPSRYLGINFDYQQQKGVIFMNQHNYIEESALKFRVEEMRPYKVLMEPGFISSWIESTNVPYRGIIGVLSHIARQTRPDILYAFSVLSKHLAKPSVRHWNAAKRVLAYLYHTRTYELCIGKGDHTLRCYSDATWADDIENRRSRTGGVVMLGDSPILCWSKQQQTVALSSCEAEYNLLHMPHKTSNTLETC